MPISRRSFFRVTLLSGLLSRFVKSGNAKTRTGRRPFVNPTRNVDPWIDVSRDALQHNTRRVARLVDGRPILAVVKNNAYGLGLKQTTDILSEFSEIGGFAAVKSESCLQLRESGISKPILLMGLTPESNAAELIQRGIQLSAYTQDAIQQLESASRQAGPIATVHFYLDTGMGRMGMPFRDALPWMESVAASDRVLVRGTYMAFTEETEFDKVQLARFRELLETAKASNIPLGQVHAASSNGAYHLPDAHFDMVRPGIALYGAYPSRPAEEKEKAELIPAFSFKTTVVRVAQLQKGDGVSYGRNYVAEKPTWTATLSVGHADGYSRKAVDGARVLIGDSLYPVIGAVSASHTIVEVGEEKTVSVGDTATLIGPEHPAIHPNNFADTVGVSVYDVLMHMNPSLERRIVA